MCIELQPMQNRPPNRMSPSFRNTPMSRESVPGPRCSETVRPRLVSELRGSYQEAWQEWEEAGEEPGWDAATADGLCF